jgi:hypothetical protein
MRSAVATRNSGTFTLKCKRGSKSNYDPGFDVSGSGKPAGAGLQCKMTVSITVIVDR